MAAALTEQMSLIVTFDRPAGPGDNRRRTASRLRMTWRMTIATRADSLIAS